jgi:hypothetical protein
MVWHVIICLMMWFAGVHLEGIIYTGNLAKLKQPIVTDQSKFPLHHHAGHHINPTKFLVEMVNTEDDVVQNKVEDSLIHELQNHQDHHHPVVLPDIEIETQIHHVLEKPIINTEITKDEIGDDLLIESVIVKPELFPAVTHEHHGHHGGHHGHHVSHGHGHNGHHNGPIVTTTTTQDGNKPSGFNFTQTLLDLSKRTEDMTKRLTYYQKVYNESGILGLAEQFAAPSAPIVVTPETVTVVKRPGTIVLHLDDAQVVHKDDTKSVLSVRSSSNEPIKLGNQTSVLLNISSIIPQILAQILKPVGSEGNSPLDIAVFSLLKPVDVMLNVTHVN